MKVFLSSTISDATLAKKVADTLRTAGLDVWYDEFEIMPGDNWAAKVSEGLTQSDAMVVLLTPDALDSTVVRREIEFALASKAYSRRLFPVLVGNQQALPDERVPWILRRLKTIRLAEPENGAKEIGRIADELLAAS